MKKLFALLAVAIGVVACQKDQADFGVNLGGEQETTINVVLSEETRANSALSSLDNGVLNTHNLRFILEIYHGDDCYRTEAISDQTYANFPVRLVPHHEYKIAVWADFVEKTAVANDGNNDDLFYKTNEGLGKISFLKYDAMTEARDAYYGTYTLTDDKTAASIPTITLKRPFAKVRVITNDLEECAEMSGMVPDSATVTYAAYVNDKFNVLNGAIGSSEAVKTKAVSYPSAYGDASNLFVDYILVDQTKPSVVKFDLNVTDIVNRSFNTDIAVEANKITTIIGNILTDGTDLKIEVDDDFADDESEIPAELLRVLQSGGNYTLTEDLKVYRDLRVNAGADVTLNLGGKTIEMVSGYEEANGAFVVEGNLTIEGEGTVKSTTRAIWTWKGNTVIKGGKFIGTNETIYASAGGKVEIRGGEFEATDEDETSFAAPQHAVLNLYGNGADGCDIKVYGGSFKNFNPADNVSENPKKNFCADGYVSVANGEWFDVIYDPYYGYTKVSNVDGLKAALTDNSVEKIYLAAGEYDLNDQIYYLTSKKELIAEVADNTLVKGKIVADGADLTATNIKFGRNNMSSVNLDKKVYGTYVVDDYSAIITLNYAAGTFENCIFNGDGVVAINYFQDKANKVLNVNKCTFVDTYIYSKVLCNITNNTFNLGGIPYGICVWPRPAGSTNSICYFVNNTLNSTYFPTENLAYCQVMLLSQSAPYANLEFNIQGNSGANYTVGWTNSVIFKNDGSVTFADGSKTFNFPKLVD